MSPAHLENLRSRHPAIRKRWETLLRLERVTGPLANPDALMHLIPATLQQVFAVMEKPSRAPLSVRAAKARLPGCECGNNPYLAYFIAGEQALIETLVLMQAELPVTERKQADVTELRLVTRRLARGEIDAFCGICVHRGMAPKCRHALVNR